MALVDQYGNPISTKVLKTEIATPSLTGVRRVLGSHPTVGLTPQRLAQLLISAESGQSTGYLELAEEMEEKYLHYLSVLNTRKRAVVGLEITVEAADDSAQANAHADLLRAAVPVVEAALYDMMDAVGKGYSVPEILWDTSAKQWMPRELAWRDPRWFQFDKIDGRTLRLRDDYQPDGLALPPWKFITHVAKSKSGIPIRGGLARAAAWCYLFQNYAIKDWVVFAEIFGQPIRLGKYEDSVTSPEQIQTLLDALRAIGTDAAAAIPKSMDVNLVAASGRASADLYERLAQYMDAQISKGVLGQTLTTETSGSGGGAYALGKVHNDVRYDILHSDCKQITATLNRDLTRPIIDLNFGPQTAYPKLIVRFEEPADLTELAENLVKLRSPGVDAPVPVKWALAKFGIPEAQDGETLLGASLPSPASGRGAGGEGASHRATHVAAGVDGGLRDELDDLADLALSGWQPLMQPLTHPIVQALDGALAADETLEQFAARLPGLLEQMDVTPLAENLTQTSFVARLAGNAEATPLVAARAERGSQDRPPSAPAATVPASTNDPHARELLELQIEAQRQSLRLETARAETERRRLEAEAETAEAEARAAQSRQETEELQRQAAAVRLAADEMAMKELSGE